MGTITYHNGFGTPGAATSIVPGTPISGGSGDFTVLSASVSFVSNGNFGAQCTLGKTGQGGKVDFIRGSDGTLAAGVGMDSAASSNIISIFNNISSGEFRIVMNRQFSGISEAFRFTGRNDGSMSIGNNFPNARFQLPPGGTGSDAAPLGFKSGPLQTTPQAGSEEFLTNDRYYTGTDGTRRRYAVNSQVMTLRGFAVAGLPPTPSQGDKAFVTDALAPTYLTGVTGGGAVVTEVFYNGAAWVCT